MIIHPIELGFFVEFKNHKDGDFTGGGFRQTDILGISTKTTIRDGFFRRKEDKLLEFTFNHALGTKRLLVNVEDKHVPEILGTINTNKTFSYGDYLQYLGVLMRGTASFPAHDCIPKHLCLRRTRSCCGHTRRQRA